METSPNLEQEIAAIEQKLAEKKQELSRESLHSVVQEKIQEHISDYQPAAPPTDVSPLPPVSPSPITEPPAYLSDEFKNKIQELVNIAFNESLDTAFKALKQTGNPALIDAFHDVLVDQLYNVLVERGKLKKI